MNGNSERIEMMEKKAKKFARFTYYRKQKGEAEKRLKRVEAKSPLIPCYTGLRKTAE